MHVLYCILDSFIMLWYLCPSVRGSSEHWNATCADIVWLLQYKVSCTWKSFFFFFFWSWAWSVFLDYWWLTSVFLVFNWLLCWHLPKFSRLITPQTFAGFQLITMKVCWYMIDTTFTKWFRQWQTQFTCLFRVSSIKTVITQQLPNMSIFITEGDKYMPLRVIAFFSHSIHTGWSIADRSRVVIPARLTSSPNHIKWLTDHGVLKGKLNLAVST